MNGEKNLARISISNSGARIWRKARGDYA